MAKSLLVFCCVLVAAASISAQEPAPPLPSCSTNISSCGCVIKKTGIYTVQDNLNANQTSAPNCIEIAASYADLNVNAKTIVGNGTGIGILIRSGATHVAVQGVAHTSFRVNDPDPCGTTGQGLIYGWNNAIEDDGDYAVIGLFSQLGGSAGANNNAGVYLNGVTGSAVNNFIACDNGVAGVIASNSSGISVTNFTSNSNADYGVWSNSTNDSEFGTCTVMDNGLYGYWFMSSSRDQLTNANGIGGSATNSGIVFGCKGACKGNQGSNDNIVINAGASGTSNVGIWIQNNNNRNMIINTSDSGNGNYDLEDDNKNCGTNNWYNNVFGTRNQDCIN